MRKILAAAAVALTLVSADLVWASAQPAAAQVDAQAVADSLLQEVIIGFEPGFLPNLGLGDLLDGLPISMRSDQGNFLTVKVPNMGIVRRIIAALPGVSYAEANGTMKALATPNDPRFNTQYGPVMIGAPAAWSSVGYGNANVIVATVDSGVLATHEDLAGPRLLQGHDYVKNDGIPDDTCGHGTHVAGIIGASANNNLGIAGVAQVSVLPMKALAMTSSLFSSGCSGSYTAIAQAIMDAADQGARVISMSIGGTASSTLQNALNYAYNKGVVLVAAAGNDGSTNGIDYPGAYPNVIAVGALDSSKARASYSDRGPQLDIMAPGSAVISTYTGSNSTYGSLSGTSMATPHVSAAIGLALGCMPAPADLAAKIAERDQVTAALYSTADDLGTPGWDSTFGNGLTRVDKLVLNVCPNAVPPPNQPPTASFTAVQGNSFGVNVNAASSSDPDGDALTYSWNFGDGGTATGVTAQHTYAAAGTYAIQLTVDDGHGHTAQSTQNVTPTDVIDTDPGTISVTSGQVTTLSITASTPNQYRKIYVPGGTTTLQVNLAGPACSPICNPDGDLYVQKLAKPTATKYVCRPYLRGSNESCTISNPQSGYWYMWVKRRSGTGNATLTATLS